MSLQTGPDPPGAAHELFSSSFLYHQVSSRHMILITMNYFLSHARNINFIEESASQSEKSARIHIIKYLLSLINYVWGVNICV